MTLPPDFTWGVATSAYQIEGAWDSDRKGPSIWDRFSHTPGRILGGDTGDVACDHYHRYAEDIGLMARLGVDAYRFSISWPRIVPEGSGEVDEAGLDFYDRLVDALLEAGITPWCTLYHWDLPQALEERGGWRRRGIVDDFVRYTEVVIRRLGDRVRHWITHNEPWVAAFVGHLEGVHAPGLTDWDAALRAGHHILLSHGRSVPVIRSTVPDATVGIALDCRPSVAASDTPADRTGQRHFDGFRNRWFLDPVFGRGYPDDMLAAYRDRGRFEGDAPDFLEPGDAEAMGPTIDFLGVNYYTSIEVAEGREETEASGVEPGPDPPAGHTEMGWRETPAALTGFLERVHQQYAPPSIAITENGASYSDGPDDDGRIRDDRRIAYLASHIDAVERARALGVPVDGYFVWSLLDNFEWSLGYSQRFGLVWVDHSTQERIPKDSFDWYRARIERSRSDA